MGVDPAVPATNTVLATAIRVRFIRLLLEGGWIQLIGAGDASGDRPLE